MANYISTINVRGTEYNIASLPKGGFQGQVLTATGAGALEVGAEWADLPLATPDTYVGEVKTTGTDGIITSGDLYKVVYSYQWILDFEEQMITKLPKATYTTLGIASFSINNFTVTAGAVVLKAATSSTLGGVTVADSSAISNSSGGIDVKTGTGIKKDSSAGTLSLEKASDTQLGGVTTGNGITASDGSISVKAHTGINVTSDGVAVKLDTAGGIVASADGIAAAVTAPIVVDSNKIGLTIDSNIMEISSDALTVKTATDTQKGVAYFSSANFSVLGGMVSLLAATDSTLGGVSIVDSSAIINSSGNIDVKLGTGLEKAASGGTINLKKATTSTLGGVMIRGGLKIGVDGVLDVNAGDGLDVNSSDNTLNVVLADENPGLTFVSGLLKAVAKAPIVITSDGIGLDYNEDILEIVNNKLSVKKATATVLGVASFSSNNFTVTSGAVTLKAASGELGGIKTGGDVIITEGVITINSATTSNKGLMTATHVTVLNEVKAFVDNYEPYVLPAATADTLGGVTLSTADNVATLSGNNLPILTSDGKIPDSMISHTVISQFLGTYESKAAMEAATAGIAHNGDWAYVALKPDGSNEKEAGAYIYSGTTWLKVSGPDTKVVQEITATETHAASSKAVYDFVHNTANTYHHKHDCADINDLANTLSLYVLKSDVSTTVTSGDSNPVSGGAVYTELTNYVKSSDVQSTIDCSGTAPVNGTAVCAILENYVTKPTNPTAGEYYRLQAGEGGTLSWSKDDVISVQGESLVIS